MRIFACQHKTRETVWIPELMKHANGAKRLERVLVVSADCTMDAAHLARMIDSDVKAEPDGAFAVASGSDRADFVFLTKDQLGRRYPEVALAGLPERGGAGLVLATSDFAAAENAIGSAGVRSGAAVCVPLRPPTARCWPSSGHSARRLAKIPEQPSHDAKSFFRHR